MKANLCRIFRERVLATFLVCLALGQVFTSSSEAVAILRPLHDASTTLEEIDKQFRSSQRHISAQLLWREAQEKLAPQLRYKLAHFNQAQILKAAGQLQANGYPVNKGVVENWLKIHQMVVNTKQQMRLFDYEGEYVDGLPKNLDTLVEQFPQAETAQADEVDFHLIQYKEFIKKHIADNDMYNFRTAAGHFMDGSHLDTQVTFSLFSRGKKKHPFMIALGQEQILYLLESIRFTEAEIRHFKEHPKFAKVPESFWEYLRNFKFKGKVQMVPIGTMVRPNAPAMLITGNPVETQIIETLIIPIINYMSLVGTTTLRIVHEVNGIPVAEGGHAVPPTVPSLPLRPIWPGPVILQTVMRRGYSGHLHRCQTSEP